MPIFDNFLLAIGDLGGFAYWIIFLASFLESIAVVGLVLPGSIVVIFGGFLAAQEYLSFGSLIWFVAVGAILGDTISYYLGTKGVRFFKDDNRFLKVSHLERGKKFFNRHGNKSIFLGRFVGPLRPIIPLVAGLSGMNAGAFILWDVASSFVWSVLHLLLGYFFGSAISTIEIWVSRLGVFAVAVIILSAILWFAIKKGRHFSVITTSFFKSFKASLLKTPRVKKFVDNHTSTVRFFRNRFIHKKFSGLPLTVLTVSFIYLAFLFFGVVQGVLTSNSVVDADVSLESMTLGFYHPLLVKLFLLVTQLGDTRFILATLILLTLTFLGQKKIRYILAMWVSVLGSQLFVILGKVLVHRPRPTGFNFYQESTFSFPSLHAAMAVAFYGFLIYMILRNLKVWKYRTYVVFSGLAIIVLVGFSRMYLGVHFLSDVLGGYLAGGLWLIVGIVFAEWHGAREKIKS